MFLVWLTVMTRSFEISVSMKSIGFPLLSLLTIMVFLHCLPRLLALGLVCILNLFPVLAQVAGGNPPPAGVQGNTGAMPRRNGAHCCRPRTGDSPRGIAYSSDLLSVFFRPANPDWNSRLSIQAVPEILRKARIA
jgi:hypothetical protein